MTIAKTSVKGINPTKLSAAGLMNSYRLHLEASNKSPKTIKWYLDILSKYFAFLELNNLMKPVDELNKEALEAYIIHRKPLRDGPTIRILRMRTREGCHLTRFRAMSGR